MTTNSKLKSAPQSTLPRVLLTWREAMKVVCMSRNTIRANILKGTFPRPRQLQSGAQRFVFKDIESWANELPYVDKSDTQNSGGIHND